MTFNYTTGGKPFFFRGGATGCLLIHGFTAVPAEMRWLGEYLAGQGHTVLGLRQTGHGTDPEDLQHSTWRHWLGSGADALHILRDQCERVFVMGLSMGGMTALNLAKLFPVDGIVTMSAPVSQKADWRLNYVDVIAPVMPYQKKKPAPPERAVLRAPDHYSYPVWPVRAVKQFAEYVNVTRANLPAITAPILITHSRIDTFILPENADLINAEIGSKHKELLWLEKSDHIITEGPERGMLFEQIGQFIKKGGERPMTLSKEPPVLSVILATPDDYQSLRQLVRYLAQQTIRDQLELVLVTPEKSKMTLATELFAAFWGYKVVETGTFRSVNHARSTGIQHATAPIVVLTEDHCFPAPTWAAALVAAHQQPWAGVGPTFGLMNLHSFRSWAMFFIQYAPWIKPTPGGVLPDIAGHNSSYKRNILLEYGSDLEKMLDFEYTLHQDLQRRGHQLFVETRAETFHVFMTDDSTCVEENYTIGRLLAATRARFQPGWKNIIYCLTTPLVPPLRTWRIVRQIYSLGWQRQLIPGILPWLIWFLLVEAWGEFTGYLFGIGYAQKRTLDFDFHRQRFVSEVEKQRIWGETLLDLTNLPTAPQPH